MHRACVRAWQRTAAEIPIIEWLLDGNSLSLHVFEVRTGGKGAIQRHEGWEPRGIMTWQQFPILLPLEWGERPRLKLCPGGRGGRKDPCPSQALCFSSWQKKRQGWCIFLVLCSSSPAVQGQQGWGCSEPQQTPAPPAPKPSSSVPG